MDFVSLILFLILYYVRPHEWPVLSGLESLRPVTLVMMFAIITMFKSKSLKVKDFFVTPHDSLVFVYCLWMVLASPSPGKTFTVVYPLYFFYIVTVQALGNMERIRRFLYWWAIMILVIASLALVSYLGFDPTDAQRLVQGHMKGRLCLGTSIFNNANALGHSVVPVVLMLYFLFVWKRPIFVRIGAIPLFAIPIGCIYLTLSKGSFLSGFATLVVALTFGRPKTVQLLIVMVALTGGWAGIKSLPRMQELQTAQSDEAIRGRLAAFQFGREMVTRKLTGVGKDRFVENMVRYRDIYKAAHSSYVQVGGELGLPGFFMFIGLLYCSLRTLFTANPRDDGEERVRRLLVALLISYMVSSWMVDFAYRASFFMMLAAVAAFHRLLLTRKVEEVEEQETVQDALSRIPALSVGGLHPVPAGSISLNQTTIEQTTISIPLNPKEDEAMNDTEHPLGPGLWWNKIRLVDWILIAVSTFAAYHFWGYVMYHI